MNIITADLLRGMPLPEHGDDVDKDERGQVMVIGGGLEVPGSVLLGAIGALRAGAGKLQIATCRSIAPQLGLAVPEALVIGLPETDRGGIAGAAWEVLAARIARANAILVGPGMMEPEETEVFVAGLLEAAGDKTSFVLDAGALHGLRDHPERLHRHGEGGVITPHAGEMASLLGVSRQAVAADPLGIAHQAASMLRCVVALKGGVTHVVSPGGKAWLFQEGSVGLATSGSGDTLAGVIAGLLARGTPALLAAMWGVYLHGEAGNRLMRRHGGIGFLARELLAEIPAIMAETTRG